MAVVHNVQGIAREVLEVQALPPFLHVEIVELLGRGELDLASKRPVIEQDQALLWGLGIVHVVLPDELEPIPQQSSSSSRKPSSVEGGRISHYEPVGSRAGGEIPVDVSGKIKEVGFPLKSRL